MPADAKLCWITRELRDANEKYVTYGQRPARLLAEAFDAAPEPVEMFLCPLCGARSTLAGHPHLDDISQICPGGPVERWYAVPTSSQPEPPEEAPT